MKHRCAFPLSSRIHTIRHPALSFHSSATPCSLNSQSTPANTQRGAAQPLPFQMCTDNFQEERIMHQWVGGRKKRKKKREEGIFILLDLLRCTSYFPHLFQSSFLAARESSFALSPTQGKSSEFFISAPFGSLPAATACPGSCSVANGSDKNPPKIHQTLPLPQQQVTAHLLPEKLILYLYQYFSLINHRERKTSQEWKITFCIKIQCHFETWNCIPCK